MSRPDPWSLLPVTIDMEVPSDGIPEPSVHDGGNRISRMPAVFGRR